MSSPKLDLAATASFSSCPQQTEGREVETLLNFKEKERWEKKDTLAHCLLGRERSPKKYKRVWEGVSKRKQISKRKLEGKGEGEGE